MILLEERRLWQSHRGGGIPRPKKTEVSDLFLLESCKTDASRFLRWPPGRHLTQRAGKNLGLRCRNGVGGARCAGVPSRAVSLTPSPTPAAGRRTSGSIAPKPAAPPATSCARCAACSRSTTAPTAP